MSRSAVELDFFGLEREKAAMERRGSFRGMKRTISRINPQLLRRAIASGGGVEAMPSAIAGFWPSAAPGSSRFFPSAPPSLRSSWSAVGSPPGTAPLTIFYNGTVAVFDASQDKAETILRMAKEGANAVTGFPPREDCLLEKLHGVGGDLPIARKRSLQRFLEKRKERLTEAAPYEETRSSS